MIILWLVSKTGYLLHKIFGSSLYAVLPPDRLAQSINDFISELNESTKTAYLKLIQACPITLMTVKDFFWWFEYTLGYQDEELKWALDVPTSIVGENILHFASGTGWNNFAVSTEIEAKYPGYSYNNYKMLLKKQLYEFTKDEQYTQYKVKVVSWRKYRTANQRKLTRALYIDTNWTRGYSF